jgi:hypothetical protein
MRVLEFQIVISAYFWDIRNINIASSGTVSSSLYLSATLKFQVILAYDGRNKMKNIQNGQFLSGTLMVGR